MTRIHLALLLLALFVLPANYAIASQCEAHYPFDGTLVDASGNGYDGLMIAKDGEPGEPEFVEGRVGQALHIDGNQAMRAFLDLHFAHCPKFTITAWFQHAGIEVAAWQYVLSTGAAGSIPAIAVNQGTLKLYGQGNGLSKKQAIRDSETWNFVAATFDYDVGVYKLHWRNRPQQGRLIDKPYSPEDSFWIGTRNDDMKYTAQNLNVDEVRVYGRILSDDEIRDLSRNIPVDSAPQAASVSTSPDRSLPAGLDNPDLGTPTGAPALEAGETSSGRTVGQLPAEVENPILDGDPNGPLDLEPSTDRTVGQVPDDIENPDLSRLPGGIPDPQYESPEAAEEAARRRAAAQAEEPTEPRPTGPRNIGSVRGTYGVDEHVFELTDEFLRSFYLGIYASCAVRLNDETFYFCGLDSTSVQVGGALPTAFISALRVCNGLQGEIRGVEVGGDATRSDGSYWNQLNRGQIDQPATMACGRDGAPQYGDQSLCRSDQFATGLVVHTNRLNQPVGLQLICRSAE